MSTSAIVRDPRVKDVRCTEDTLEVSLRDGRKISAPISWFPRLAAASVHDRGIWEVGAAGYGIHWPLVDEDLSVEGLLRAQSGV